MACTVCPKPTIQNCPPFVNLHTLEMMKDRICADCVKTVPTNTPSELFVITGWGTDGQPECCDLLYVFEGSNLWFSADGNNWNLSNNTATTEKTLFFSETKTDNLSNIFNINNIPTGYDEILIKGLIRATSTTYVYAGLNFNGDTNLANYSGGLFFKLENGTNGAYTIDNMSGFITDDIGATPNIFVDYEAKIQKHEDSIYYKTAICRTRGIYTNAVGSFFTRAVVNWDFKTSLTSIQLFTSDVAGAIGGTFKVNSSVDAWVIKN